jgi:hypothetical protein
MKSLGEQLREDQHQLRTQRINLFLKMLCVILTLGYIWIIIKTIN